MIAVVMDGQTTRVCVHSLSLFPFSFSFSFSLSFSFCFVFVFDLLMVCVFGSRCMHGERMNMDSLASIHSHGPQFQFVWK